MSFNSWLQSVRSMLPLSPANKRHGGPTSRRPRGRLGVEALEDRWMPSTVSEPLVSVNPPIVEAVASAQHQVPFHESLTVVAATSTGIFTYEGYASHIGHVTAVSYPDNTFVKIADNGDRAFGYLSPSSATTGTLTFTGGTGRFAGLTGTASYVLSTNPETGATHVKVNGFISFGPGDHHDEETEPSSHKAHTEVVPFKVTGGGTAPQGLPVFPGGTAPHNATGTGTLLGNYTGNEGSFELLSLNPTTGTGTFRGSFVFVAANGDRLAMNYGADPNNPGTFKLVPVADGKVVAVFIATFTPDPQHSTGRFADVTGGSFIMVATSEPFLLVPNAQGYTPAFAYTWVGEGTLEFSKEKK